MKDTILLRMPHARSGAREIIVGSRHLYYSGEELIAYRDETTKMRVTISHIGETIRRHLIELGCMDWPALPETEFDARIEEIIK